MIAAYPNPASNTVRISGLAAGNIVMMYGVNGQLVATQKAVNAIEQLDISQYANGVYQVIVIDGGQRLATIKLVKNSGN